MKATAMQARTTSLRLLLGSSLLVLAAGFAQPAPAAPHDGPPPAGPMGLGPMGPAHLDRMLDAAGATPEQRGQIRSIFEAAHADLKAQRESGRALREQQMALFTQPVIDAATAEKLRQQMLAQHDAASKRMMQAMLDAGRVLTVDQRRTLAEQMQQRRDERALPGRPAR